MTTEALTLNERASQHAGWTYFDAGIDPPGMPHCPPDCEHSMDAAYALLWPLVAAKGYSRFEWNDTRKRCGYVAAASGTHGVKGLPSPPP